MLPMEPRKQYWRCLFLIISYYVVFLLSAALAQDPTSISSLDSAIRDYAFRTLIKRRTSVAYAVDLPANMTGIDASVVRMRSGSLWSRGLDSSAFHIPPRTVTVPYARRLVVVYQDLGNWSSTYFSVPAGYTFAASVVGCFAYEAAENTTGGGDGGAAGGGGTIRELKLMPMGGDAEDRISIIFPGVSPPNGQNSTMTCVRFGEDGSLHMEDTTSSNVCSTKSTGHFTIVVPTVVAPAPAPMAEEGGRGKWKVWVIACVGGAGGLLLLSLVVCGCVRLKKKKKMVAMESQAEEGEALGSVWVGNSKVPSATMVRTQPVIEDENAPN